MNQIRKELSNPKILWVDDDPLILSTLRRFFRKKNIDIDLFDSPIKALNNVLQSNYSVIISDQRMPEMTGVDFLKKCKEKSPKSVRLMVTGFLSKELIKVVTNEVGVFRFLVKPWNEVTLISDLNSAIEKYKNSVSRDNLLGEIRQKNSQLENYNENLENLIFEKTKDIEESRKRLENDLKRNSDLVSFMESLIKVESIDEWFEEVRSQFRRKLNLNPILLSYESENENFIKFEKGSELNNGSEFLKKLKTKSGFNRDLLAKTLGRPIGQVFELTLELSNKHIKKRPVLLLEHGFSIDDVKPILLGLVDKVNILSVSFENLYLKMKKSRAVKVWEKTFDSFEDPIAIVDGNFNVIRHNHKFKKIKILSQNLKIKTRGGGRISHTSTTKQRRDSDFGIGSVQGKKCFEMFADRKSPCLSCPRLESKKLVAQGNFPIRVSDRLYNVKSFALSQYNVDGIWIHYYEDVTEKSEKFGEILQTEKMAALGNLAGMIAHELNNPLTGIQSLSTLIADELPRENQTRQDFEEIAKASIRCQKIINNLMAFTQSREENFREIVDINKIVSDTMSLSKTITKRHNRSTLLIEEPTFVNVNPYLVQQVLFNLIKNSAQAMAQPGNISIQTSKENGEVIVEVKDSGPGIPKDLVENLFKPFVSTKGEKGTGLGLSLSKAVIERFGGRISVTNLSEGGACFQIRLKEVKSEVSCS